MLSALIERWRPETNTFHILQGETTITLEDVEVLTGLPTRGHPISVGYDGRDMRGAVGCQTLIQEFPWASSEDFMGEGAV
ncbi:Protein MAIN-LIKE 1 [Linum perenne]